MMHPNAIDLEAVASGDAVPAVSEHLRHCAACRAHVEALRALLAEAPSEVVAPVPRRRVLRLALPASSLSIAAALALWFASGGDRSLDRPGPSKLGATASTAAAEAPSRAADPADVRFKGGLQLAVVRERDGLQERFATTFAVRPGDRLRLELAVDESATIAAGVLGDDGSFVEVLAPKPRDVGTHLADRAVRVDERPISGYAMAGTVDAMENARRTGDLRAVTSLRVEWSGADAGPTGAPR